MSANFGGKPSKVGWNYFWRSNPIFNRNYIRVRQWCSNWKPSGSPPQQVFKIFITYTSFLKGLQYRFFWYFTWNLQLQWQTTKPGRWQFMQNRPDGFLATASLTGHTDLQNKKMCLKNKILLQNWFHLIVLSKPADNWPGRISILTYLLAGSVVWISFRASMTSNLSVRIRKKPFNSLETFLQSDYG